MWTAHFLSLSACRILGTARNLFLRARTCIPAYRHLTDGNAMHAGAMRNLTDYQDFAERQDWRLEFKPWNCYPFGPRRHLSSIN